MSTPERRVQAIEALLETLKADGRALIFVWALEQKSSRRGWDHGDDQDVMVPWVMTSGQAKSAQVESRKRTEESVNNEIADSSTKAQQPSQTMANTSSSQTYNRFYHLYKRGELETDIEKAGGIVVNSGYERDNWWAILRPR